MTPIRPAHPNDIDRLYAIEQACSQNPWTRDGIADSLSNQNSVFWVAEEEHAIIGFACSVLVVDELHILEVAVDQQYRNKGLGTLLINQLKKSAAAKNAKSAYLEVRRSNRSAIRLYEKCGFVEEAVMGRYYGDGEDAVFMRCSLGS